MRPSTTYQGPLKHNEPAMKVLRISLDGDEVRGLSAREFRDFLYSMGDGTKRDRKKSRRSPRG